MVKYLGLRGNMLKNGIYKKKILGRAILLLLIIALVAALLPGCKKKTPAPVEEPTPATEQEQEQEEESNPEPVQEPEENAEPEEEVLAEDGWYYTKEDVALYIYTYGHLPENFMTKKEAQKLGWSGGSLEKCAEGFVIGGDTFGNYEGNLPRKQGRTYKECDIDTLGKSKRGAKRIVFSNDGLIYYTEDHYETFELLYGEENE